MEDVAVFMMWKLIPYVDPATVVEAPAPVVVDAAEPVNSTEEVNATVANETVEAPAEDNETAEVPAEEPVEVPAEEPVGDCEDGVGAGCDEDAYDGVVSTSTGEMDSSGLVAEGYCPEPVDDSDVEYETEMLEGVVGMMEIGFDWKVFEWSEAVAGALGDNVVVVLGMVRAAREPYTV